MFVLVYTKHGCVPSFSHIATDELYVTINAKNMNVAEITNIYNKYVKVIFLSFACFRLTIDRGWGVIT